MERFIVLVLSLCLGPDHDLVRNDLNMVVTYPDLPILVPPYRCPNVYRASHRSIASSEEPCLAMFSSTTEDSFPVYSLLASQLTSLWGVLRVLSWAAFRFSGISIAAMLWSQRYVLCVKPSVSAVAGT